MSGFDEAGFQRDVDLRMQVARKCRHLTQQAIAERIGIPRATYANTEAGRQRIAVDVVWRAAVVMRVPFEQLIPKPVRGWR